MRGFLPVLHLLRRKTRVKVREGYFHVLCKVRRRKKEALFQGKTVREDHLKILKAQILKHTQNIKADKCVYVLSLVTSEEKRE